MVIYIYIYIYMYAARERPHTADFRAENLEFLEFGSSELLNQGGGLSWCTD